VRVVVITPPSDLPVSLDEAKRHLNVETDDDDALITLLIESAVSWIDGPAGWLGRALMAQTLELRLDGFPSCRDGEVNLPVLPVVSVNSVTYAADVDGSDTVLAGDKYRLAGEILAPAYNLSWPSYRAQREAVRIRYVAGYESADVVPAAIKAAILLMVGHLYANREAVIVGETVNVMPLGAEALLGPFRVYR
jgi:uncharacterized phiE125 gp8 family phage protein